MWEFQGWKSSYLVFSFERQQSLVQEQLAKLAQRERESAAGRGPDELSPAVITQKEKADREREKNSMLVRDVFSLPCRPHSSWSADTWNDRKTFCISSWTLERLASISHWFSLVTLIPVFVFHRYGVWRSSFKPILLPVRFHWSILDCLAWILPVRFNQYQLMLLD